MESSTYTDRKYIEASRMWVNVAAHGGRTHEVDAIVGGKKVTVCSAYWNIPCEYHDRSSSASGKFEGITGLPTTVYTDTDGKEIGRAVGGRSASELVKMQKDLLEKIPGDKIPVDLWNHVKKLLADGESDVAKGDWKEAIKSYTLVTRLRQKALKEKGEEALAKVNEKGRELIADAKGKVETDKGEAKKILRMVASDFKPLECSKEALAALKEIPADEHK